MMSKFIELHDKETDIKLSFNVDKVTVFSDQTIETEREGFEVAESYDEIKTLIKDAGVLIHKADLRLDTTTPLTLEDLKNMIGEPVWNSNALKWGLLTKQDGSYFLLYPTGQMWLFTVNDLIKFPLYRMRQ